MRSKETSEQKEQLDRLVATVLRSPKYRNVCEDLIRNIGVRELSKRPNLKIAIKSTKNKLHQICGAYFLERPNYRSWLRKLTEAKMSRNRDLFKEASSCILSYHYSTKERLNILDEFYDRIFSFLPEIHSVMDVACGFHPLSIPWMPLSEGTEYYAYDIYRDMIDFLNKVMALNRIQGHAEVRDIMWNTPEIGTDMAFILNTLPCLEQVEKSAGLDILESINADHLIVSFPLQSLGGLEKNMLTHYEARFNEITREKDWDVQQLEFKTELVFLVSK